jgi:hypothetical protein
MTFEYQLPIRGRALPPLVPRAASEPVGGASRVARLLALAHKLENSVRSGQVKDYSELARLARASAARIQQIVLLALLAPDIQECVLFLPAEQAGLITAQQLRAIAREPRWDRQRERFQKLLGRRG